MTTQALDEVMCRAPVIPVIVIDDVADAVPMAQALVRGGLPALEVTLRTPAALEALQAMAQVPGALVGAGTVLDAEQLRAAVQAGARFLVSPGYSDNVAAAAHAAGVPWLPGTATAGEVMRAREAGCKRLKFFPAERAGGVAMLDAFRSVFRDVVFCPTGGITLARAPQYLALDNVACVGGSWVVPKTLVAQRDWAAIERLAVEAAALPRV
jgi:2-dehydro-3-deoxyphosphogluconate aldolase/(4S)-4-hydroxy-2-oxoglutarate aldolase